MTMLRVVIRALGALAAIALVYVAVLAFPQPLFQHYTAHGNFEVWSDAPIDPAINSVLDDATRRLATSELYDPAQRFRIFFCNEPWRLWLYGQRFSSRLGGAADTWLTRNIYIRASDIAANAIRSPGPGPIADAAERTLSYYIAHEATHILTSRTFGRLMALTHPTWLVEGYADYVGKGGAFDFEANRALLIADDARLDYARSGLYRGFHLRVALLLDKRKRSIRSVFADPPPEADLLDALRRGEPSAP